MKVTASLPVSSAEKTLVLFYSGARQGDCTSRFTVYIDDDHLDCTPQLQQALDFASGRGSMCMPSGVYKHP